MIVKDIFNSSIPMLKEVDGDAASYLLPRYTMLLSFLHETLCF